MRTRLLIAAFLLCAATVAADQTVQVGPGLAFSPSTVAVMPGEKVTWAWPIGSLPHSTTSDSQVGAEVWDSGIQTGGATFAHTFNTLGNYPFYCSVHSVPGGTVMNGIVQVVAPTATPTPSQTPTATPTTTPTPTPPPVVNAPFFPLSPCRLIDTRNPDGSLGGPALTAGGTRTFVLSGQCGIPAGAKAVSINVTVTGSTAAGDLRLFAGGASLPLVSTINYSAGQTRANNAIALLGSAGDLAVHCDQASGTVQLIIDVNGYFQ